MPLNSSRTSISFLAIESDGSQLEFSPRGTITSLQKTVCSRLYIDPVHMYVE